MYNYHDAISSRHLHLRFDLSLTRFPLFRRLGFDDQGMQTVRKLLLESVVD